MSNDDVRRTKTRPMAARDSSDERPVDVEVSARGIVQCLRMLADEAASLGLTRTGVALETALLICTAEGSAESASSSAPNRPPGAALH